MKVLKSKLVKEVLASPEATQLLREAMRSSQSDSREHDFTFKTKEGREQRVVVSSVPKAA